MADGGLQVLYVMRDRVQAYWLLRQLRNRKKQEWKQLLREPYLSRVERDIRRAETWIKHLENVVKEMWVVEREEDVRQFTNNAA